MLSTQGTILLHHDIRQIKLEHTLNSAQQAKLSIHYIDNYVYKVTKPFREIFHPCRKE